MTEPLQKHSRMPRKYDNVQGAMAGKHPSIRARDKLGRAVPVIPKDLKPTDILPRLLADERMADIAASLHVTRSALNMWFLETCEDDWKKVQVARAITRKEGAEDALDSAPDPLSLARARERLKAAQWDLERICRRIYGEDRAQLQVQVQPILVISVAGAPQTDCHAIIENVESST